MSIRIVIDTAERRLDNEISFQTDWNALCVWKIYSSDNLPFKMNNPERTSKINPRKKLSPARNSNTRLNKLCQCNANATYGNENYKSIVFARYVNKISTRDMAKIELNFKYEAVWLKYIYARIINRWKGVNWAEPRSNTCLCMKTVFCVSEKIMYRISDQSETIFRWIIMWGIRVRYFHVKILWFPSKKV